MKYQFVLAFAALLIIGVTCEETTEGKEVTETCVPGEKYEFGCNSCICPESGKKADAACTLKACSGDQNTPTDADVNKCTPGSTFMKECNTCTCPEDGSKTGAACTTVACPSESS